MHRNRLARIERASDEPLVRRNRIAERTMCGLEERTVLGGQVPLVAPCSVAHVARGPRPGRSA